MSNKYFQLTILVIISFATNLGVAATKVVIVGVNHQDDKRIPSLRDTKNDVTDVEQALVDCGIVARGPNTSVKKFVYGGLGPKPLSESVLDELTHQAGSATTEDILLFFFSGHAITSNGETSLVFQDSLIVNDQELKNVVSLRRVREILENSKAKTKLLFVDSCYSGSIGKMNTPITSFRSVFKESNLYVITSSQDDEVSLIWPNRRQSLATRWLCHGLRGAADANQNGLISIDELFGFLEKNVNACFDVVVGEFRDKKAEHILETLEKIAQTGQHPTRIITAPWDNPDIFAIQPREVDTAFKQLGKILSDRIMVLATQRGISRDATIGVLPFTSITGNELPSRGKYPILEQIGAPKLEEKLLEYADGKYTILRTDNLVPALKDFKIREIHGQNRHAFRQLMENLESVPDILVQTRIQFHDAHLILDVELLNPANGGTLSFNTTMVIGNSSSTQESVIEKSEKYEPMAPIAQSVVKTSTEETETHESNGGEAESVHPHWSEFNDWPIKVEIETRSPKANWVAVDVDETQKSEALFSVQYGQNMRLVLTNKTDRPLAAVLIVDGINVLGKKAQTPHEALNNSGYWIIHPHANVQFDGWYLRQQEPKGNTSHKSNQQTTKQSPFQHEPFVVVDPPDALATQLGYSASLGDLRLHIYETKEFDAAARAAGIGAGRKVTRELDMSNRVADREKSAYVSIYKYVDANENQTN